MAKKCRWYKIAETKAEIQLAEKMTLNMEVSGKKMCLAKFNDQFFACANTCPHASGVMSSGWIDELGNIVCPLHRYKFSLANGRNTSGEGYFLKTYLIEERPDGIYVGIPETGLFGW